MSRNSSISNSERPGNLKAITRWLKVIAEPKRLQILDLLMQGVQCNCELSDALGMAPNLVSHHMNVLRQAGLLSVERDAVDSRWVYYSINRSALDELNAAFDAFFDAERIQPRQPQCGPRSAVVLVSDIAVIEH
jgi:ArsR family transcriptional regulator